MKSEFFSQEEFERGIYRVLEHGDEIRIAEAVGVSASTVSQYFNPGFEEKESPLYKAAAMMAAWMEINPEAGSEALHRFILFVERGMPDADLSPQGRVREATDRVQQGVIDLRNLVDKFSISESRLLARELVEKRRNGR